MDAKILATADLHLGMRFAAYPEVQSELSESRFAVLDRLVEMANSEQCGLFIVAGDLFDRLKLPKADIIRAAKALGRFDGSLTAVLPGNHDYYGGSRSGLWNTFREQAGDATLLLQDQQAYDLSRYGLDITL